MFQNISYDEDAYKNEDIEKDKKINIKEQMKNIFSIQNIVLYFVSFMLSTVSINGGINPFGLAIFASCCSNKIPAGIVFIVTALGTLIKFGGSGFLFYILASLLFIGMTLIFRPVEQEERNEKKKLGMFLFISVFLVNVVKMFFNTFLVYDLLTTLMMSITTYLFYKIFVNSILVINQYKYKKAFTIEEVIGASLLLSIAATSLGGFNIFGISVSNVCCIVLVMILGWKNGVMVGATGGITIGCVLGIIQQNEPIIIAIYAVSGLLAGILNKLGKIGVIIGFILGNALLTYVTNQNAEEILQLREILIASLALLAIPKNVGVNIQDIVGKTKLLPVTGGRIEGQTEEAIYKLNSMSETISEMAKSYTEAAATTLDENIETACKRLFEQELLVNIENFENNILYDDIVDIEEGIIGEIYDVLEKEDILTKENIIEIFENHNNYIVGFDDKDASEKIDNEIRQVLKIINETYRMLKLDIIWKQKEENQKKVLSKQLEGVSKAISNLADEISVENVESKERLPEKYRLEIGSAKTTKNKSKITGDNSTKIKLHDSNYMIAISDGMGSGELANKSSKTVINMLERLLTSGFDKEISIDLINSAILNSKEETYATIDASIINLVTGNVEFIKNGACPTYLKNKRNVDIIKSISLPAGILDNVELVLYDKELKEGDILVMCSDGIIESAREYVNKEIWLKGILEQIETEDVQKIADIILGEAIDNGFGMAQDDMTVMVIKICKK